MDDGDRNVNGETKDGELSVHSMVIGQIKYGEWVVTE